MFRNISRKVWLKRLKNKNFTIISNDCWGGEVYRDFNIPYFTPFVGLMMMAPCYLELLKDLQKNLSSPLTFISSSKYEGVNALREKSSHPFPIGLLNGSCEVHFLHYQTPEEALNLFIKFDGSKDYCTSQLLEDFDKLPFRKKLCFGNAPVQGISSFVYSKGWISDGKAMYKISCQDFDVVNWLNCGSGKMSTFYRVLLFGLSLNSFNRFVTHKAKK
jgi:uncharacterized protein (DUF1919 family)